MRSQRPLRWTFFNLETAVGREKEEPGIVVCMVKSKNSWSPWFMRHFCIVRGAPRACVDFCDQTAVSRFKLQKLNGQSKHLLADKNPQLDRSYIWERLAYNDFGQMGLTDY